MDTKKRRIVTGALALTLLFPMAAAAQSFGSGVGAVAPNLAGLGSGPDSGVEVTGEIYSKGMETPSNVPLIRGEIGRSEYTMTLKPHPLMQYEAMETGKDEDECLHGTQVEFYRIMTHKTVRIVADRDLRNQLAGMTSYGRPLGIRGAVSDAASPILMVQDIVPLRADVSLVRTKESAQQAEVSVTASGSEVVSSK